MLIILSLLVKKLTNKLYNLEYGTMMVVVVTGDKYGPQFKLDS